MITIEALVGLALVVALIGFAMWCCYRAGRETGYEQGRADRLVADDIAKRGRHAKSQPRASTSPASAAADSSSTPKPTRTALVRSGYRDSWRAMYPEPPVLSGIHPVYPVPADAFRPRAKPAVTAENIQTVLLPPAPAPALTGAADTGTMPKVKLSTGDTGEMRAIMDGWIAENIRPEVIA